MALKTVNWQGLLFRPLVISAMVSCVAAGWIMLLQFSIGNWHGEYLIALVFLVTFETLLTERQWRLRQLELGHPRSLSVRLAEIGLVLVLIRVVSFLAHGGDWLLWLSQPDTFFDFDFVIGVIVVGTMWVMAHAIASHLVELEDDTALARDRDAARQGLTDQFILGAVILLTAVGLQRLAISGGRLDLQPARVELGLVPLVYIGLGLLLFAQVRLSMLLAAWHYQRIPVSAGIERRWAGWSAVFVAAISVFVLFLPAGNTLLGLYLLTWLIQIMAFLGQVLSFLILFVLTLVFSPCLLLFRLQPPQEPVPPPPPLIAPPDAGTAAGGDWLAPLRALVFWVVIGLIVVLAARVYLRDRRFVGVAQTLWEMLRGWWDVFYARLRGWAGTVRFTLRRESIPSAPRSTAPLSSWWERWRAHTARERVRRLYLALLQRATRAGHARQRAQTPYEFSTALEPHVSEHADELSQLTEAFVQARYSRRDFEPQQVSRLHRIWERLQAALRVRPGK